jgi:hypothetical protein
VSDAWELVTNLYKKVSGEWLEIDMSCEPEIPQTADLLVWLETDSGLSYDSGTKAITSWLSQIGSKSFTQKVTNVPMLADTTITLGGNPTVKSQRKVGAPSADDCPRLGSNSSFTATTQELTSIIVCRMITDSFNNGGYPLGGGSVYGTLYTGANLRHLVVYPHVYTVVYTNDTRDYTKMKPNDSSGELDLGEDIRDNWFVIVNKHYNTGGHDYRKVFVNGVETDNIDRGAQSINSQTMTDVYLGSYPTNSLWGFIGNIAAFLLWDGALTDDDCVQASQYFMDKYSIT